MSVNFTPALFSHLFIHGDLAMRSMVWSCMVSSFIYYLCSVMENFVPIYKKGDKTDCNNYRGISLLPTTYKILSNILLWRLPPYAEEIIGDHQCGFRCYRSTTDHLYCIRQMLEKKWEYSEAVHRLFIDFKKAYDSVRREFYYNILTEFGIPKKLIRLIKMCLTETYIRVRVGKNLSDMFPIRNGLKQGDALSPLLFNFALEYAIRRVQVN